MTFHIEKRMGARVHILALLLMLQMVAGVSVYGQSPEDAVHGREKGIRIQPMEIGRAHV